MGQNKNRESALVECARRSSVECLHAIFNAEIDGLKRVLTQVSADFHEALEALLRCEGKIVVAGIGKSGLVGRKFAATLSSTGTPSAFLNAGEAVHGDLGLVTSKDVLIVISNSGETPEILQLLPSVKKIGCLIIGLLGNTDSTIARACSVVLDVETSAEGCPLGLAPMASATASMVVGDAIAAALIRRRGFNAEDFAVFHPGGALGRRLLIHVKDVMHSGEGVPVLDPKTALRDALVAMNNSIFGGVLVATDAYLLGVFTDGDLRRLLISDADLGVSVGDVMTKDPICVSADATLGCVLDTMEKRRRKVYFVPVVDGHDAICGVVRMHDVIN